MTLLLCAEASQHQIEVSALAEMSGLTEGGCPKRSWRRRKRLGNGPERERSEMHRMIAITTIVIATVMLSFACGDDTAPVVVEKIVEVEVPVEVVREVPVEAVVEREVIREVPVEVVVEKTVIKEVPVEVVVEKEVPVEVVVEVVKEVVREVPVEVVVEKEVIKEAPAESEAVAEKTVEVDGGGFHTCSGGHGRRGHGQGGSRGAVQRHRRTELVR